MDTLLNQKAEFNMDNFKINKHYVVRNNKIVQIDLSEINEGEPSLYITSNSTSPL